MIGRFNRSRSSKVANNAIRNRLIKDGDCPKNLL